MTATAKETEMRGSPFPTECRACGRQFGPYEVGDHECIGMWGRLRWFARSLLILRRQRLLSRHNIRAMWRQSQPRWRDKKSPALDAITDEEWDAFMGAIS